MNKKTSTFFDDEAKESDDDEESYNESQDTPGSLVEFIVEDESIEGSDQASQRSLNSLMDSVSTESSIQPNKRIMKRKVYNSDLSDEDLPKKKKAGRPKGSKHQNKDKKPVGRPKSSSTPIKKKKYQHENGREKPIGHHSFPISNYSLTITRGGGLDIPLDALDAVEDFLKRDTQKGGAATEVGARNNNLHIQSAFSVHYPKTPDAAKYLAKYVRSLLPLDGKGYKIQCKPFSPGQTWEAMIGYITKDQGRQSYQIRTHNITPSV